MAKLNGNIPPELIEVQKRLEENVQLMDGMIKKNGKVFEQFQHLVRERNACIVEGKKLAAQHRCTTDVFSSNEAEKVEYDPDSFREVFGPKKLAQACQLNSKKLKAMVETGIIEQTRLDEVDNEVKNTIRVTPKYKEITLA